jgi:hypothetical protein
MFSLSTPSFLQTFPRVIASSLTLLFAAEASAQTITGFSATAAAAGSSVTINGTNLASVKSVSINGQKMLLEGTPTANAIAVKVPSAASTGRIRLNTVNNTPTAAVNGSIVSANKLGIPRRSSSTSYAQVSANSLGFTAPDGRVAPVMGDFDNDGLIDMLLGQGNGTILRFEQTAANSTSFSTGALLKNNDNANTTLNAGNMAEPILLDLNGDNLVDLLVGNEAGSVTYYEQASSNANANNNSTSSLAFTNKSVLVNPYGTALPNAGSYARPTVGDLDSDGLLDILVGSNDGTLRHYEQTAANATTFTDQGRLKLTNGTDLNAGEIAKPLLIDCNGDGALDLLIGNKAGAVLLFTQNTLNSLTFNALSGLTTDGTTALTMGGAGGYAAPSISDLDGNGFLDLFVGNGSGTVYRFEQGASAITPIPLPVVLTSFTGHPSAAGNMLRWTTASEANSDHFELERSANGQDFVQIGRTAAAGTTTSTHAYQFVDAATPPTTSYYRLRQVDFDGTDSYSPVITLVATTQANTSAYPSPFAEALYVAGAAGGQAVPATAVLYAPTGQPVYSQALTLSAAPQALPSLPVLAPGLYILRLTTAAGTTTQRINHR